MTLRSIARGPRPSMLPANPKPRTNKTWAEVARQEMARWGGRCGGVPGSQGHSAQEKKAHANLERIMDVIAENPGIRRVEIIDATGISKSAVESAIIRLVTAGRAAKVGGGKHVTYEAVK